MKDEDNDGIAVGESITPGEDLNESIYFKWDRKQVLIWIKLNLINNGLDNNIVKSFLKEFSQKYVTGAMLEQFYNNPELIKGLKAEFSQKHQVFGIWMVFETSLRNIGDNVNHKD